MGEWHKVEQKPYSPCDGCEMGFCSLSQKEVDGVLYSKTEDCHETCDILRDFNNPEKERLFFNHIREAYATIRKKSHKELGEGWQRLARV